jgi:hypothetical protein
MTEEKFKEIKELQSKIEKKQTNLRTIDGLLQSCGVGCKITGTPIYSYNFKLEYQFSDKSLIVQILESEKEKISNELKELQNLFETY